MSLAADEGSACWVEVRLVVGGGVAEVDVV